MNFAFGARMHGLTPALQAGVPALFIAHDARVREMCEFFKLPFIAEQDLPTNIGLDYLLSACDYTQTNAQYPAHYARYLDTLRRHGIQPNTKPDGHIADFWEPEPDLAVANEESNLAGAVRNDCLQRICSLASTLPDSHFETIRLIKQHTQECYQSTR